MKTGAMRLPIPALESGDQLSRYDFERRYRAMPENIWAELIDGIVYLNSGVRAAHASASADVAGWLGSYRAATPGVMGVIHATLRLDTTNEPQPDATLYVDVDRSTRVRLGADGYLEGVPEFIAEVSASSVSKDLGPKLKAYARNGVQEYLVWRVEDEAIDWFTLREGLYVPLPVESGIVRSRIFPGLWLDVAAMADRDIARVLMVLQQGLATPEHTAFVAQLEAMPRREVTS
jgi:hypothetical protein